MSQTAAGAGPGSAAAPGPAGRSSTHSHYVEPADSEPGLRDTVNNDHTLPAPSRGLVPQVQALCGSVRPAGGWSHGCGQQTDVLAPHQMLQILPHLIKASVQPHRTGATVYRRGKKGLEKLGTIA